MKSKLKGMLVTGTYRDENGSWHSAHYLSNGERWFIIHISGQPFEDPSAARIHASIRGFQMNVPYLKDLTSERDISIEDEIELVGPLELLAGIQEDFAKQRSACSKD
jgi:hypothetical protein